MKKIRILALVLFLFGFAFPSSAWAQSYLFEMVSQTMDYTINDDGTATIAYEFVFQNDPNGGNIEYVDVGLPNPNFDSTTISADVDGIPITDISTSGYQGFGNAGVALGLGNAAIRPGERGTVHMVLGRLERVLFPDTEDAAYTSTNFSPTYFGSQYMVGKTNLTVRIHFPAGVQPEEPRWHEAPNGWAAEPQTGFDDAGRVMYTWNNPSADPDRLYEFGASFPVQYIPNETIANPTVPETIEDTYGISTDSFSGFFMCLCGIGVVGLMVYASYKSSVKRKLQYLPPKVSIEGHGIKRGLTAVEAAILLEQPLDKILTMILFSVVKKGAASVVKKDPLELKIEDNPPQDLRSYETAFLLAFTSKDKSVIKKELQKMMIDLVDTVSSNMKGFSRRETVAFYKEIMNKAWAQVESAETPEVKMEKYSENLEWTMLDKNYDDRTKNVFQSGPVIIPNWWGRYDPTFHTSGGGGLASAPAAKPGAGGSPGGGGFTMPQLPGSSFAASVVNGVQNFSSKVVGNISDFTGTITNKTNPVPVSTSSGSTRSSGGGGGGGRSCACACACACAGCACACAGGGR